MTYAEHLLLAKGSHIKAAKEYRRERRWTDVEWYRAWDYGPDRLRDEVEAAARALGP